MRGRPNPVEALVTLPRLSDPAERQASWRQAIAALGQSLRVAGPLPLDGVEPELIVRSLQVALETGLCDDLDFISPGSAAVALYELTAALPHGRERRELGRRVFARLYQGTAATFAAVATRMALGAGKPLETPTLHARVALLFDMPIASTVKADGLALALVTRRELFERWITEPATRALHSRRLAAKLLEHAAREACVRAQQGDNFFCDLLTSNRIAPCFEQLLGDREPLVWRHVAVARGLLAAVNGELREQIDIALDSTLSPTEWRRAAVSLVACLVAEPALALKQCKRLLASDVARRDPGIAASMVWGLPRVIEAEPDAAEQLLDALSVTRRPDVAEAVASLISDVHSTSFGSRAGAMLASVLGSRTHSGSPLRGIAEYARRALDRSDDSTLRERVRRALLAYEAKGARPAYELALEAIGIARAEMDGIFELGPHDESIPEVLALLGDLDENALERSRLGDLLLLGRHPGETDASVPEIDELYERLGNWVLTREQTLGHVPRSRPESLADQRALRALLHLVDLETAHSDSDDVSMRARVRQSVEVLVSRLCRVPDPMVHRILCATLARSCDAAVREGVFEPSDLLLAITHRLDDRHSMQAIAEASTHPDVRSAFAAYSEFLNAEAPPAADDTQDDSAPRALGVSADASGLARKVVRLSRGLAAGGSYRSEALRRLVLRIGRSLEAIALARGLSELVDSRGTGSDPVGELESAADRLRLLSAGAIRRVLSDDPGAETAVIADVAPLSALLERTVSAGIPANPEQVSLAVSELVAELPSVLASAVSQVLAELGSLPIAAQSDVYAIPLEKRRTALPDWLLPRRTIGAFYVVRALGSGGVSSVFIARRIEERHTANADAFALKVPQYDPTTARSLSEQQFMQMFREEAGALLSLPQHPNLARFVTFDLAARPKPILVMELIRGIGLDRLIRSRSLRTPTVFMYLDGILAGLEAMHRVSVGHLDVKPSNVILRDGETPVLVDFGLSGRHLRPGCGTLEYCAPEVLGVVPHGLAASPLATDMYAFACLAFELLRAELLFDAEDEMALISLQLGHDGWPPKLTELGKSPECRELAVVLAACLRRDPRARPSATEMRAALAPLAKQLEDTAWPVGSSQGKTELTA